jgi:hypothetical protein
MSALFGIILILAGLGAMMSSEYEETEPSNLIPNPKNSLESELNELERMEKQLRREVESCL